MATTIDTCSICADQPPVESASRTWVQCDSCSGWYHADCLKISATQVSDIDRFHCPKCEAKHGPSTMKPERRKSQRESTKLNYADLNEGLSGDEKIWGKVLKAKTFAADKFARFNGADVTLARLRKGGMTEPFVIEDPAGLGMVMPPASTTVSSIAASVGKDLPVEVIDVATQASCPGWTMERWATYFETAPEQRDRIRNVISLEISGSEFGSKIVRPQLVRDMDWIDQVWPAELKPKEYPKVQLYCLMGTQDSYTDFHIDFGGTSVFYHIVRGSKVFYFIEPTSKNLKKYQKWSSSPDQSATFLGDEVKTCYAVHLQAGNTMIIPTGWIHAVYTPEDALVIGGNFLHGLNIGTQLRIYDIEEITNVPAKFRFPFFKRIHWYAVQKYTKMLQDDASQLSLYELQGLTELASWLQKELGLDDVDHDVPLSIARPHALIKDLLSGIESATAALTAAKRGNKQTTSIGSGGNTSEKPPGSPVIKLKLKISSSPTPPLPPQLHDAAPKLKSAPPSPPSTAATATTADNDDVYYYNDDFDDEFADEDLPDSDDQEYDGQEVDAPASGTASGAAASKQLKLMTTRRKRRRKHHDSSSDDDMGSSSKPAGSRSRSPSIFGAAAAKKTKTSSVKQRLLDRMTKK